MANITGMRAVLPYFVDRDLRDGPLLFTDIHQSNVFVDDQWHIKRLIDLEWACPLPMEWACPLSMQMQDPPYRLTSQAVDQLTEENLAEYDKLREEFMEAFEYEEKLQNGWSARKDNHDLPRTRTMRKMWETGSFFHFHALDSTTGLFNIWGQNIQPKFSDAGNLKDEVNQLMAPYWSVEAEAVVAGKTKDREGYISSSLEPCLKPKTPVSPS